MNTLLGVLGTQEWIIMFTFLTIVVVVLAIVGAFIKGLRNKRN